MDRLSMNAPRKPCPDCVRKHLAQACVLCQEALQGYPAHRWLAIGYLAEAEAEIEGMSPAMAERFRDERKALESDPGYQPPFEDLIAAVTGLNGVTACACQGETDGIADRVATVFLKTASALSENEKRDMATPTSLSWTGRWMGAVCPQKSRR